MPTNVIANEHKPRTVITPSTIPVTVFTGFLGAGKTTIILNLLKRTNPKYKIILLKNEFGDAETDSALIRESHIQVTEMTNGCLCCVLVGQMKRALEEMKAKYHPDRIIIETSGSAFPAPIAWQIREMENEGFHLDAILTVVDCVNFSGYEDTSYTARMQAQYTDLVLLNKWELVNERQLDIVVDHINDLNTDTPKLHVTAGTGLDPDVVFGIDTNLFKLEERDGFESVNTDHHTQEVDLIEIRKNLDPCKSGFCLLDPLEFLPFLRSLSTEDIFRVKGIVRLTKQLDYAGTLTPDLNSDEFGFLYILNHAFGRFTFTPVTQNNEKLRDVLARVTIIGRDLRMVLAKLKEGFNVENADITTSWAH